MDSDHRSRKATDLQSAPFDRSGTPPYLELRWKSKAPFRLELELAIGLEPTTC